MDTKATEAFFRDLHQEIDAVSERVLKEEGQAAAQRMRQHFLPFPQALRTGFLNIRSARLINAIGSQVSDEDGPVMEAGILSDDEDLHRIAQQQEIGRAFSSSQRDMVIPAGDPSNDWRAGLTPSGVRRFSSLADAASQYNIFQRKDKPGLVFGKLKGVKGAKVELLAVKRRTVRIPKRPFIAPELATTRDRVMDRLDRELPNDGSGG